MQCKYGIDRAICQKANGSLGHIDIKALWCRDCTLDKTVEVVLDRFRHDEKARYWIRVWLRQMGFDVDLLDTPSVMKIKFRCPVISADISIPCALNQCRYHIDYPWFGNCLLAYLHDQEIEQLSVDEVAFLYQRPVEEIKQLIEESTGLMRSRALEVDATGDSSLTRQFRYFPTDLVCCVCESEVDPRETARSLKIDSAGMIYCSKECRDERPPRIIELEVEKGIPINRILDWTFRRYRSLTLVEQALGMPRWLIGESCQRFLGHPLEFYFAATKTLRSYSLIRRSWRVPGWIAGMIDRLRWVRGAILRRHGPPSIQTEDLRQGLNYVIGNL